MKRKIIGIPLVIFVLLVLTSGTALAWWIGGPGVNFKVEEALTWGVDQTPFALFPGQTHTRVVEVENRADVSYGLKYNVYVYWKEYEFGVGAGSLKETKPGLFELTIVKPESKPGISPSITQEKAAVAGGYYPYYGFLGTIALSLDSDGPNGPAGFSPYTLLTKVNIVRAQSLRIVVRPAADIPSGEWRLAVNIDRGEPLPETTQTVTATPTATSQ